MSLRGNNDQEKLNDLCSKNYKEQSVWFLNAFWDKLQEKEAENLWKFHHKFADLDQAKGKSGNELDELNAHRFLEAFDNTHTVKDLRDKLRSKGALKEGIAKYVPITHYLAVHYDIDWHRLVNAAQGDNAAELIEAQRRLDGAVHACEEAERTEKDAKAREAEARSAQKELDAQQAAYDNKTQNLTAASETGGLVSRNKAKNELAQHLAEDPLPLRRARITQEAAVKKATDARQKAEAALAEARAKVAEAESYLEELRMRSGSGQGSVWWMQRELTEVKKYLPTSKGGIRN